MFISCESDKVIVLKIIFCYASARPIYIGFEMLCFRVVRPTVCACVVRGTSPTSSLSTSSLYSTAGLKPRPSERPKKTWKEVVREDCQARKLNKEDAMDRCKWRKVINEAR